MGLMLLRSGILEEFGRSGLPFVRRRGRGEKYPREAKTILAGSTVQYLAGTKIRAQPGAPSITSRGYYSLGFYDLHHHHIIKGAEGAQYSDVLVN